MNCPFWNELKNEWSAIFVATLLPYELKKYRKAEYVQRRVGFVNVQSSLHENDVFFVCACMDKAANIISIMWNFISGKEAFPV